MCDFKKWCRLVATRDEGKVTLSNVYHDCKRGRVPQDRRREFYDKLIAIADDNDADSERQLDRVRELLESHADRFACSAVDDAASAFCSHFIPDFWLLADNADGLRMGWSISDVVSDSHRTEIEAGRARWGTIPPKEYERAWVTRSEESDTIPRGTAGTKELREKLGLLRFLRIGGAWLMEIRYDKGAAGRLAPPTFLDGSTFVVYRSRDTTAMTKAGEWGKAVDLGHPKYEDGFSEAVHRRVNFTAEFAVRSVGLMEYVAFTPDPVTLLAKMPIPWHDALADELEQLLR
jgi:hypothetical protein